MIYLSYAIAWGLAESIIARSLYSIHHYFLYRTLSSIEYSDLSICMGIIYGLFAIIDLGLFDSIGPWYSHYTASKRHLTCFFLPQLFFSWFPLIIIYAIMFRIWSGLTLVYILIGIAEHTKRQLRLFLNVAGYARMVAITEGIGYISYIILVWLLFFYRGTHTLTALFYILALTSIISVIALTIALSHLYRRLEDTVPIPFAWRPLLSQRSACTLSNLMTTHGLHTIALPFIARYYTTDAALLSCINAIISAMSTIIYKMITIAGTIAFNFSHHKSNAPHLAYMLRIISFTWMTIILSAAYICYTISCPITSYLLISLSIYATQSIQHLTKLAFDAQFKSFSYSIIITFSNLITHLLFYLTLTAFIPGILSVLLIASIMLSTLIITYSCATRTRFIPAHTTIIDQPIASISQINQSPEELP